MLKLIKFLKPFKKQVILGPLFKLIEAIFELIVPIVMARILDIGVANNDIPYVLKMGGVLLLLAIVGFFTTLVCQRYAAEASQGFGTKLRSTTFSHIMGFSNREIDQFGTHSLITRLTLDINQLQIAVAMLIRLVIRAPFLVIGAVIMAMSINLRLSLIFLIVAPLVAVALFFIIRRTSFFYKKIQKDTDHVSSLAGESLSGSRVIRAFSTQEAELSKAKIASKTLADAAIKANAISSFLNPVTYILLNLAIVAILWFGGFQVSAGTMTQGEVVAFVNYISQILVALVVVANLIVIFTKAGTSAARINEVLATTASVKEAQNAKPIVPVSGAPNIEVRHASFSYHEHPILHDISFSLKHGETLGIIGGTGAGKSMLTSLLIRSYDVTSGEILIHGVDIRQYPLKQLHQLISIVPQNTVLFTGTIADNLRMRDQNATEEQLYRALKTAQCLDFIDKLPDGLNHRILEGGKNLSGGQRQRLTIARALIGNPEILILDDSTSALDYLTDANLRAALRNIRGITPIIISQRISSVRYADKILVLDHGKVMGIGKHEELLATSQIYAEIMRSQEQKKAVRP